MGLLKIIVFFSYGSTLWAAETNKHPILPNPQPGKALTSIEFSPYGIFRDNDQIYLTYNQKDFLTQSPFRGIKGTNEDTFGQLVDSQRIALPKEVKTGAWINVVKFEDKLLVMDGMSLQTFALQLKDKKSIFLSQRTLVWDLVFPPRDRQGEPTSRETSALRARFKTATEKMIEIKISGLALAPKGWQERKTSVTYLLATRIPSFPVLSMDCERDEITSCQVRRACFVHGLSDEQGKHLAGIGVSEKKKLIVLGDSKNHQLIKFRLDSCLNVVKIGTLQLPTRIKTLNSIHVDAEDRLWVSTLQPDDYHNASVFTWDASEW